MKNHEDKPRKTVTHLSYIDIPVILFFSLLAVCVLYVFRGIATHYFLLDDGAWLERGKKGGENLKSIFQPVSGEYFEPVLNLIFSIHYFLFQLEPAGYYVFNIGVHFMNCVMVYNLFLALAPGNKKGAFLSSMLFAVLYAHHQAVFWISASVHLVSTAAFLLTLLLFVQYDNTQKKNMYYLSILSFIVCLLTKESTVSLPLVLLAYLLCFKKNARKRIPWKKTLPFFILSFIYLLFFQLLRGFVFQTKYGGTGFAIGGHFLPAIISSFLEINLTTLGLVTFSGKYAGMENFIFSLSLLASLFILLLSSIGKKTAAKNQHFAGFAFGLLFFFCSFALFSFFRELLGYGSFHRYRYFYLPSAGFCLSFGYAFSFLFETFYKKNNLALFLSMLLSVNIFYINVSHTLMVQRYYLAYSEISKTTFQQIGQFIRGKKPAALYLVHFPEKPVLAMGKPHLISMLKLLYGNQWKVFFSDAAGIETMENTETLVLIYNNGHVERYTGK